MTDVRAIPDHVPPELVRNYEQALAPTTLDDPYAPAWNVFQTYPPVFYARSQLATSDMPGAWVCTHYEDIREVFQNTERCSSHGIFPFHKLVGESFTPIPIALDPPEYDKYRMFLNPWFSPKAVDKLDSTIRQTVNGLIDGFADKAECDAAYGFGRIYQPDRPHCAWKSGRAAAQRRRDRRHPVLSVDGRSRHGGGDQHADVPQVGARSGSAAELARESASAP